MAGPSAVLDESNNTSTYNTNFKRYSPPSVLRARTSSNLDSQSTRETEPTPTPKPRRKLKDATLPSCPNPRRGSSTALSLPSDLAVSPRIPPHTPTTSSGIEHDDTEDEDVLSVLDEYNIEGVSKKDLKLWMQCAPEDQKLERVHDTKFKSLNLFEARYDTEGINQEDLELWHELAPPDQRLETESDTEMEMDEMDFEPRSRIPKLDLKSLHKAAPTEARRGRLPSRYELYKPRHQD